MPLSSDSLIERSYLKRKLTFWRVMAILFAILLAVLIVQRFTRHEPLAKSGAYVARFRIENIVTDNQKQQDLLKEIEEDDDIKALIVYLDTPGGSAAGGETLKKRLQAIAKKKPVVSSMRSVCASAGYMIALGTDRLYALDGTLTGSIGVILESADISGLTDKIGVKPVVIKSGPYKDIMSPARPMTPEERQLLQTSIDSFYDAFVDMVAERRKLPRDEVLKIADGRIFSGRQALQQKLIDAIGGEDEIRAWLAKEHKIDADLPVKDVEVKDKFEKLLDKFSEYAGIAPPSSLSWLSQHGLVAIWEPGVLAK